MKIVMLGPPGSGKGTQAHVISELYGVPVVTTGDMLREAVANETEYGNVAGGFMSRGELVPDHIVNGVVGERLSKPDLVNGFILDGFPRSRRQAEFLDGFLEEHHMKLDYVIHVTLDDETIVKRLSNRRSCPQCGEVYHLVSKPPKVKGVCDKCCAELVLRNDDKPDVIRNRLKVYREKTQPLLDRYAEKGIIREAPGDHPIEKLPELLRKVLG
ncbi:adenylate kinase [Candidatus Bathyarchaeota archaeon]|nr:adenylate kinase [Candidatus Bathyarchaeota archaeon]